MIGGRRHWKWLLLLAVLQLCIPSTHAEVLGDLRYQRENGDPEELKSYPPSIFQHWVHRIRYRCDACHNHLFEMTPAEAVMTHDTMGDDKLCNSCHNGKTAFDSGFNNCHRCHISEEE
jgi:c(7)-type cytochrome triheme protein